MSSDTKTTMTAEEKRLRRNQLAKERYKKNNQLAKERRLRKKEETLMLAEDTPAPEPPKKIIIKKKKARTEKQEKATAKMIKAKEKAKGPTGQQLRDEWCGLIGLPLGRKNSGKLNTKELLIKEIEDLKSLPEENRVYFFNGGKRIFYYQFDKEKYEKWVEEYMDIDTPEEIEN